LQPPASPADQANQQLVDRLIAEGALWSPPLIGAFRATPRHRFLDRVFVYHRRRERWRELLTREPTPETLRLLYSDRALITRLSAGGRSQPVVPISSSSQPSLMAQMLEDLKLSPGLRVCEVGAGTGYNAALLAHVVAPGPVLSVDVDREVLAEGWDHLRAFPERRVELRHADGRQGCPDAAPFGRIVVTAATPDLEPAWLEQLADRGLLQAPLTFAPGLAFIVRGSVSEGAFHGRLTRAAYFMPLRAEAETGAGETQPPPREAVRSLPAPWAGWFDRRRPRVGWLGFSQSLAFYGLLRGLRVHYRTLQGQPGYGVHGPEGDAVCWFGAQEWHVSGGAGRDLGTWLWRAFLEAGGPWPTEFRLKAAPGGHLHPGSRRETYLRQGPRCQQLWELSEPRDRPAWL
jgi:protein-L-isoaspartate(D-aspartate) O-methyltransferase